MTREMLEAMGLSKEQIDKIMAENGKDIEKAKGDLSTKETELADTKQLLVDANKKIEGFKDLDIETIKKDAEDYKLAFEKAEREGKENLDKLKFDHKLESALTGAKAKNTKTVKALLNLEGLKLNEGEIVGLKEQLETIQKENDYLFESTETDPASPPNFIRPSNKDDKNEPESLGARLARQNLENK